MEKKELVRRIAEESGYTQKDSEKMLNAFIEVVGSALEKGESIKLLGFGAFEVRKRAARTGRNPRNPEEIIQIPESKAAVFKAGKILKERVNK